MCSGFQEQEEWKQRASGEAVVTVQARNDGLTKAFPVGMERKEQIWKILVKYLTELVAGCEN